MEGGFRHKKFKSPNKNYINFKSTARPKSPSPKRKDYQEVALRKSDKKSRCTYIHPETNKRCKIKLGIYPRYCHLHTLLIENLKISKSKIPNAGNGLFAGPYGFNKGDLIGEYALPWMEVKGETLSRRKNPDFSYVFCKDQKRNEKDETCYDGIDIRSTIVRNANDAHGSVYKNNAYFNGSGQVIASKKINPFEEIFINYGETYVFH